VLDFGIAKIISDTGGSPISAIIGTPHYASPEQFQAGSLIDGSSDIYSLGVISYQMLTGALPFDAPSIHEVIRMKLTEPPPSARDMRPTAPALLDRLISQMLAKDPSRRPQRAIEVAAAFEKAIHSRNDPSDVESQTGVEVMIAGSDLDAAAGHRRSGPASTWL